jgi:hypothetical protein
MNQLKDYAMSRIWTFRTEDIIYALSMITVLFLLGLLLVLYAKNVMIEATSEKIVYTGITGKSKEIMWNQVNTMSFNPALKEITLKSKETKIKLHIHLKGIGNLIRIIHENVDVSIYRHAFKDLGVKGF